MSSRDARLLARKYYDGSGRQLEKDMLVLAESARGVVVFTPRLVVLMKAVDLASRSAVWMDGPDAVSPDAWYIHLLAGDLRLAFAWAHSLPHLPFFCFQRGLRSERFHILPWSRLPSPEIGIHQRRQNNTQAITNIWDSRQK